MKNAKQNVNGEFTSTVEAIDPRLAAEYLKTRPENQRTVKGRNLSGITASMASDGEWVFSGDPIRFNENGQLMDGQHRLLALIATGKTFKFVVQRNVPNEAFMVIDTGSRRSPADVLKISGYKYTTGVAAAIRAMIGLGNVAAGKTPHTSLTKATCSHAVLLQNAKKWGSRLEDSMKIMATGPARQVCHPPGMFAALHFLFSERNAKEADTFFKSLIVGDAFEFGSKDPIFQLRNTLINNRISSNKKRATHYLVAVTIKAWNLYMDRQSVITLQFRENETWPAISNKMNRARKKTAASA
jgi:hypothetical protein